MACSINLNDQLTDQSTGGYFVYLGYVSTSTGSQVPVNGENSTCFGITNYFAADANNPYIETPGTPLTVNPQTEIESNNATIDFEGVTAGFYGFAYVVGDNLPQDNPDGVLTPPSECGDTTCFEIEVVDSPNMTAPTSDLTFCEASLPVDYDLTAEIGNYISGGEWAIGGNVGTINQSTGVITFTVPAVVGNFTVTYTLSVPGGFHTVDEFCADCTQVISFTLTITAASVAGTATSLAVCN